jgi:hypothetical protein
VVEVPSGWQCLGDIAHACPCIAQLRDCAIVHASVCAHTYACVFVRVRVCKCACACACACVCVGGGKFVCVRTR